jgi:hypothetical protein
MTAPLDTLRALERRIYDFARSLQAATEKAYEAAAAATRVRAEAEREAGLSVTRTPAAPRAENVVQFARQERQP